MIVVLFLTIASYLLFASTSIYYFINYTLSILKTKISTNKTANEYGLFIIELSNNGKKYKFLLDSGANGCVLDSRAINILNAQKTDYTASITGISGNEIQTDIYTVDLQYKKEDINRVCFQIIENFDLYEDGIIGILGYPYLNGIGIVLDYKKNIVWHK